MKLQYRAMTTNQRRLAVAGELRRLTEMHGTISGNKWNNMRDRSLGLPGVETAVKLFNCGSWVIFRERALAYTRGDKVPGDTQFAATLHRDRRRGNTYRSRMSRSDGEVAAIVDEMAEKAVRPDWRSQPLILVAADEGEPHRYYCTTRRQMVTTLRYTGGHFGHAEGES